MINDPIDQAFDAMPLATVSEEGVMPDERLKRPNDLRIIYKRFKEDDRLSAYQRSQCQSLRDGETPYEKSNTTDFPDLTDINWQGTEQRVEKAKAPYYRLIHGTDTMLSLKTTFGSVDERPAWEVGMAEEISKMFRRWPKFPYVTERLADKHVAEGLGILYWPDDDIDFRPSTGGLGQFYFERQAAATEEDQEIVCVYEEYSTTRFAKHLRNPERSKKKGWVEDGIIQAIRKSSPSNYDTQDWEKLVDEIKNNDLATGAKLAKVRIIHGFVKEFNGKVSHYMTTEDAVGNEADEQWIYKSRGVFDSMTEALVLFPYGTGTNSLIHGLRGLVHKIFAAEHQRNRSICRAIDKAMEMTSTMVQAENEESLSNVELTYFGNMAVLPPGVKYIPAPPMNLAGSIMPIIDLMDGIIGDRTAGYSSEGVFQGDQRKTKGEVMAHLEQSASLTESHVDFFYSPWERVLQQMVRRIIRKDYVKEDPGGDLVVELRRRIEARGIPIEAFHRIDHTEVRAIRAIGSGSAAAKTVAIARGEELYPRMDDYGQANFNRLKAVDIYGATQADYFFPPTPVERTTVDTQIAINQNFILLNGGECPVLPSDRHMAHAREHIKPLVEMFQLVQAGQADLAESATKNAKLYAHCTEHVEYMMGDEATMQEANAMRQMLQQIGEVIENGIKEAEARAEEEAMEEQEQGGLSPDDAAAFGKAQAEMQKAKLQEKIAMDKAALENQIKQEKAKLDMGIADAKAAAEIRRNQAVDAATPPPRKKKK